jgi:hypothetical protein
MSYSEVYLTKQFPIANVVYDHAEGSGMHERSTGSPSSQPTGEKWARVFNLYDDTVLVW